MLWTASLVEGYLEEAAATLRRLPPVKVQGYFSVWPAVIQGCYDPVGGEKAYIRLGPPTAAAISRMEITLTWFRWLTPDENRLIWLRANNVNWKQICWKMGCGRTTAWQRWVLALQKVTVMLNETQTPIKIARSNEQTNV